MHIVRPYSFSKHSLLVLGPRGVGKSTYVKEVLKPELVIDLLQTRFQRNLSVDPSRLEELTGHLESGATVLIDEIQKIPELMDEVHRLIEDRKLIFYLTGSSARKLRRSGVNLLAGRALSKKMYPLTLFEIGDRYPLERVLARGGLPRSLLEPDSKIAEDYLASYVETYLKEEIFQEGLSRNLKSFSRFIELAGQYHGMILNYENIAREVGVSGDTIKSWFQILEDTLLGFQLEPYPLHYAKNETKHSRFYLFDPGIARAAEGLYDPEELPERRGHYFEGIILNELKAYAEIHRKNWNFYYYQLPSLGDIDLIIETRRKSISAPAQWVTLDLKLTRSWSPSYGKLSRSVAKKYPESCKQNLAIYLGKDRLTRDGVEILPLKTFLRLLWQHNFGS